MLHEIKCILSGLVLLNNFCFLTVVLLNIIMCTHKIIYSIIDPGISVGNECDTSEDCQSLLPNSICTEEKICACRDGESSYEYDGVSYCYVYLAGEQCHWSTSDDCLSK